MKRVKEIIKSLRVCSDDEIPCDECSYRHTLGDCVLIMKRDAADALESFLKEEDDLK